VSEELSLISRPELGGFGQPVGDLKEYSAAGLPRVGPVPAGPPSGPASGPVHRYVADPWEPVKAALADAIVDAVTAAMTARNRAT
jgi:hypothetical protein